MKKIKGTLAQATQAQCQNWCPTPKILRVRPLNWVHWD